jgi:YD repeat-containing protein
VATTYAYDNLDRPVSASAGGQTIGETYDALGRRTAESQPLGTVYSQYDLADRRTQLSLPDGTHTTYDYDNAGANVRHQGHLRRDARHLRVR